MSEWDDAIAAAQPAPLAVVAPKLGPMAHLDRLELALAAGGFPAMSPWWYETFTRFYDRNVRQLVLRCGRRGGKSSSLCRIAVLEALFGEHTIPPGDVGVVAIVSISMREAQERLRTIRAILDAFDVEYDKRVTSEIRLLGRNVVFKVFAATQGAVIGFTCICAICDEVAKWMNEAETANPATEVLGGLRPTLATQPNAKMFLSSSPLGFEDAHAEAFARGDTDFQSVAYAPTWVANPSVTEADTIALEPDRRIWLREFKAEPQHAVLGAFSTEDIARAFQPREPGLLSEPIWVTDVSSGKKDSWTWGGVRYDTPETGAPFLRFFGIDGVSGEFWKTTTGSEVVERMVSAAKAAGAKSIHGDQREEFMVTDEVHSHGIGYFVHAWTATSKPDAVQTLRRMFREGLLVLPEHETLRKELLSFEERVTPNGGLTFGARGAGHDDYVALLITAVMSLEERFLYPVSIPEKPVVLSEADRERRRQEDRRREMQPENGMSKVRAMMAKRPRR